MIYLHDFTRIHDRILWNLQTTGPTLQQHPFGIFSEQDVSSWYDVENAKSLQLYIYSLD